MGETREKSANERTGYFTPNSARTVFFPMRKESEMNLGN